MNPVAASPCIGDRPGDAGVTVPSGPGVSDLISDPAVRQALAAFRDTSARFGNAIDRLELIARRCGEMERARS